MKVLVAGDYCPRDRVARKIQSGDTADLFASVKETIEAADYAIVNFECTVVDGKAKPISKCGPNLKCQPEAVKVLKDGGFDCVTVANNHFRDFGDEGVITSLRYFKANGLEYVGGGEDIAMAESVLYKKFDDGVLAIINVCENEFSIARPTRAGSAPLDAVKVYHRIQTARNNSDYVLVIVHGGHEHYQLPSPRMKDLYRFFIEVGADAVVNHHQHCYSGYEVYNGKPIFYGLGNFLFDHSKKRSDIWNEGFMVTISFSPSTIDYVLSPYIQCDEKPIVDLMSKEKLVTFEKRIESLKETILDVALFNQQYDKFVIQECKSVVAPFTPYNSVYLRAAAGRRYIPYLISKQKYADMLNYIECEAHRDILIKALNNKIDTINE